MNYRRLGNSGVKVSDISLGSWLTYGGYVERENAVKAIHTAYDLGVNFFDTANVYEQGAAETLLGETIKAFPRHSYVLATKAFWPMGDLPNDRGLSRKHLTDQFHASLKRLDVDYVDIMYCHRHDPETPLYETLRTLDDFVRAGKVLYVGVSEWTASQIAEAHAIADRYLLDRIVVNQPQYNMFNRYIEPEIIPYSERSGVGQVVFSPLAQGLLTGKYTSVDNIPEGSRASKIDWFKAGITEDKIAKVRELSTVASELDLTVGQLALAWILRQPNVASALVGASRPEQIIENAKASGVKLSQEVIDRIETILTGSQG
ncbi:aldo/keto reductase family protein [Paenibacillus pasadenensis]|uniref:aldo/keto reductase family protein n=1 Tax=Paenibacillus pasadenensis TaxID=217090 RepID=UPI0020410BAE|nr:aldo/keto reductase family protein [Paenibacillus pasadenensis]MCM3747796.1 aldo/keto reductase family protein [Paenibacillus pasadenensis]